MPMETDKDTGQNEPWKGEGGALYRHYDRYGKLLYVGISLDAINRLHEHLHEAKWAKEISVVTIERHASWQEARKAERKAIQTEHPEYNVVHKIWNGRVNNKNFPRSSASPPAYAKIKFRPNVPARVLGIIRAAGDGGIPRGDVVRKLKGFALGPEIDTALDELEASGDVFIIGVTSPSGGRPHKRIFPKSARDSHRLGEWVLPRNPKPSTRQSGVQRLLN